MADSPQIINLEAALSICDGDRELFEEIAQIFLEDSANRMKLLEQAVNSGDSQAVMKMGHALKGLSGNICAEIMKETAMKIEHSGRNNELDSTPTQLESLNQEYQKVRAELEKIFAQ